MLLLYYHIFLTYFFFKFIYLFLYHYYYLNLNVTTHTFLVYMGIPNYRVISSVMNCYCTGPSLEVITRLSGTAYVRISAYLTCIFSAFGYAMLAVKNC